MNDSLLLWLGGLGIGIGVGLMLRHPMDRIIRSFVERVVGT